MIDRDKFRVALSEGVRLLDAEHRWYEPPCSCAPDGVIVERNEDGSFFGWAYCLEHIIVADTHFVVPADRATSGVSDPGIADALFEEFQDWAVVAGVLAT